MVSYKNCILGISTITISAGLGGFTAQKAIADEINFDSQISLEPVLKQPDMGTNIWNYKGPGQVYRIAQRELDLDKFCVNYPFNSLCKGQSEPESVEEEVVPQQENVSERRDDDNWAIITDASTLGLGGAVVAKINSNLNARVGLNAFGFDINYEETRGSYDGDLNLFNVATTLDYYPFKNSGFNIGAGVVYTNNNADGVGTASDIIETDFGDELALVGINDVDDLVSVNVDVETSRNFAPYVGIGWGNPIAGGLRFWGNLGVMFPGSPDVELSSDFLVDENSIPDNIQPLIQDDLDDIRQEIDDELAQEERDIEDDIDRFNIYPVISIGLSYSF